LSSSSYFYLLNLFATGFIKFEFIAVDLLMRIKYKGFLYAFFCPPLLQLPHLATTYAAVNTLVTIGSERALSSINR
jgi:hypothetical protein